MDEFPIIEGKRFWPFRLNDLIDKWSHQVNKKSIDLPDEPKPIADFVIENHTYPMHNGRPDDRHKLEAFHGDQQFNKTVERDFWQYPEETLVFGVGDCEDVSILAVSLIGKVLNASQVYEVLGVVKDADSGRILGGHGWTYARYNGEWHYLEMTRQNAPSKYPTVPDIREPYEYGDWNLVPHVLFNWTKFEELKGGLTSYLDMDFEEKETQEKYEALAEINDDPMKPLEKAGLMAKLRW